jgi:hypothetical protein
MLIRTGISHEPHRSRQARLPAHGNPLELQLQMQFYKSDRRFWVDVAWGRIYSLVCALISNVSFLFLFVTREPGTK